MHDSLPIAVVLEAGKSVTVANARFWPGLSRAGKTADQALASLVAIAPRYQAALATAGVPFPLPATTDDLEVVETIAGNSTTDLGAPWVMTEWALQPVDAAEAERLAAILAASRAKLLDLFRQAEGQTLSTGPRGGGRDRRKMFLHTLDADGFYLSRLGLKRPPLDQDDIEASLEAMTDALLAGLAEAAAGRTPTVGKRGGVMWTPRHLASVACWHALDHAWELENRLQA